MKYYTNVLGDKHVIAAARLVSPRGYQRSMGIVVDACPYCGQTHRHTFSEELRTGVYGTREADCFKGQYLLIDEDEVEEYDNTK